jgi:hypothetical protein
VLLTTSSPSSTILLFLSLRASLTAESGDDGNLGSGGGCAMLNVNDVLPEAVDVVDDNGVGGKVGGADTSGVDDVDDNIDAGEMTDDVDPDGCVDGSSD